MESFLALERYLNRRGQISVRTTVAQRSTSSVKQYMIQEKGLIARRSLDELIALLVDEGSPLWQGYLSEIAKGLVEQDIGNLPEIILQDFEVISDLDDIVIRLILTGAIVVEGEFLIEVGGYTPGPLPSPDLRFHWTAQLTYMNQSFNFTIRIRFVGVDGTALPIVFGILGWFLGAQSLNGLLGAASGIAVGEAINSVYTGPGVHGLIVDKLNSVFSQLDGITLGENPMFTIRRPEDATIEIGISTRFLDMADAGLGR